MKKLILALVLILAAIPAAAQTTLTAIPSTKQEADLNRDMARLNKQTCLAVKLAEGCAQAAARNAWIALENAKICTSLSLGPACTEVAAKTQWCAMLGFQGTATCTHPDGRGSAQIVFATSAPTIDIYSSLQNYWERRAVKTLMDAVGKQAEAEDAAVIAAAEAVAKNGTLAQKNAYCAGIGMLAGCLP